jgi:antitoxin component HigA of HigAB toxin-antitoxin module
MAAATGETEYRRALAEMARLAEAEPDRASPEGRRLDELAALADAHEEARHGPAESGDAEWR